MGHLVTKFTQKQPVGHCLFSCDLPRPRAYHRLLQAPTKTIRPTKGFSCSIEKDIPEGRTPVKRLIALSAAMLVGLLATSRARGGDISPILPEDFDKLHNMIRV